MTSLTTRLRASPASDIMIEAANKIDAQAEEEELLKKALRIAVLGLAACKRGHCLACDVGKAYRLTGTHI